MRDTEPISCFLKKCYHGEHGEIVPLGGARLGGFIRPSPRIVERKLRFGNEGSQKVGRRRWDFGEVSVIDFFLIGCAFKGRESGTGVDVAAGSLEVQLLKFLESCKDRQE